MSEERKVARDAGAVGASTMLSRVLGLVREQVMASWFGAGLATDAFNVAFRIPNLLRDLFAEGAMASAFVPTFTGVLERRGEEEAWAFGRRLLATLLVVLTIVCAVGWIAAPWLVRVFAPGFASEKQDLTIQLTRVMLPFLPMVALAAACMGMLNAKGRFAVPALAPALLNLVMVVGGLSLIPVCQARGQQPILAMAIGVVLGGFAQFAVQLPALHALGFRLRWVRPARDPEVARVATLMLPATAGLAATQLNLFFSTLIASLLVEGSVSWLWYAFRLMQLPIGVFGVALATVSLPALSRAAVANDIAGVRTTLSATLRLVFVLTVPAALWLAAMAGPVVALLYERGRFGPADTARTADALVMYCVGLPAFAAAGVMTRAFYALGDTRTPMRVTFASVAVNLALNLALMRSMGHAGLALATSVTSIASLGQLAWYLRRRLGGLDGARIGATFGRVSLASVIVAAVCAGAVALSYGRLPQGLAGGLLSVGGAFVLAVAGLWVLFRRFRVEELSALEDLARGLLRRLKPGR